LCIIHDISEELISAQLLAYVTKWDHKELTLSLIDQFQTELLDKKAITDQRKASKSSKANKNIDSNLGSKRSDDIKALRQQFINDLNEGSNIKPTTQVCQMLIIYSFLFMSIN